MRKASPKSNNKINFFRKDKRYLWRNFTTKDENLFRKDKIGYMKIFNYN